MGNREKKKRLPLKRTLQNNVFAIKVFLAVSPLYLVIYFLFTFIAGAYDFLTGGFLLREIVNAAKSKTAAGLVTPVATLGIILILLFAAMQYYWNVLAVRQNRAICAAVEKMLFKKAASVEIACYEDPKFYDKYVKAMDEAYRRVLGVLRTLDDLLAKTIALFANSVLLFVIDPWLIVFGFVPLAVGVLRRFENFAAHDLETTKKPLNRKVIYIRHTFYLGDYAKEMRLGGMGEAMLESFAETFKEYRAAIKKYGRKRAIFGYLQRFFAEIVTIMGATAYAVYQTMCVGVQNGGMSVGDCIVVIGSIGSISFCLNALVQVFAEFGEHALYLEDVRAFLDYEPKITDGRLPIPDSGDITVNNISFRYSGAETDTLKNISFSWKRGEKIALVGANGSGKTTLVKLLLRLYDPSLGSILLDGKSIKSFAVKDYRDLFSTVLQDFKMFSLTVKENVLLRPLKNGDDSLVEEALKQSGAYERIIKTKQGLDTILTREFDDRGENLSVGEQQKLSLARVFASDSPFVLLDEPSSALDPIAEYKMFDNMMRATEGRSVIFISHRLSSAMLADKVIMLKDGKIAEMGTHDQLMKNQKEYAAMFNRQAENYLGSEVTAL